MVGGGITFATFKPCCYRLKDALSDTMLANPQHEPTEAEDTIFNSIRSGVTDADFAENN